ncbi:MAG: ABC transporter substrate-binding protein, partial [Myxococcota bacterium]
MDIQLKSPKRAALCVSVLGVLALSALVVAAAGRGAPASAESRPAYGGTVVAGLLGQPVSVDPLTADSHAEVTLVSLLFDTLYRLVGSGTAAQLMVEPHVAAALPIVSDDGLEARIPIREEIRFHGGRRLSARFVRRSLKRLAESRSGWLLAPVRTIRVADGAVVLELRRPTPELAALLAAPATAIVPPETPQLTRVIGSGPFRLARVDRRRQRVRLRAAERYFAGRPYIDQLTLRWYTRPEQEATDYEAGRAQMSHRGAVAFSSHRPAFRTGETSSAATMLTYIGFGKSAAHAAITSSSDFRRALSL